MSHCRRTLIVAMDNDFHSKPGHALRILQYTTIEQWIFNDSVIRDIFIKFLSKFVDE